MILSPDYGRIISKKHFERLQQLCSGGKAITEFEEDAKGLKMPLILLDTVDMDSPLMQEEIFGPLLPIVEYSDLEEGIQFIRNRPSPLAAYCFTKSRANKDLLLNKIRAGGITINDTLMHFISSALPFGGIGPSGMGSYHGHESFKAFSHAKAVMERSTFMDIALRYPPYSETKLKCLRIVLSIHFNRWLVKYKLPGLIAVSTALLLLILLL